MPKVSVIIPVYGVEKYIERCARSLFEQTLDDIEYLFIDDCTPDKSIEVLIRVLEEYIDRKDQVVIHHMERNSGQAAVRKWGMQNATGEYVIHCDSDDWVDRDMYRQLYEKAKEENADVVVCDYSRHNGEFGTINKGLFNTDKTLNILDMLTEKTSWSVWNKLVDRKLFEGITYPQYNMGEDKTLIFQIIMKCKKISYVKDVYYYYFSNPTSICSRAGVEKCLKNYEQLKSNTDALLACITGYNSAIDDALISLKWAAKKALWNVVFIPKFRKLWFNTYKEINTQILTSKYISKRYKVEFVLTLLYLYPKKKDRFDH